MVHGPVEFKIINAQFLSTKENRITLNYASNNNRMLSLAIKKHTIKGEAEGAE